MEAVLKEALQDMEPNCTVVFQMLDSAFYYARTDEGSLLPGVRTPSPAATTCTGSWS